MRLHTVVAACVLFGLHGCATIPPTTDQAAIDYNWAFAKARDETLVVNVLRAAEREPLIFSTIVSVVGGVRTGASLELPFTNVIAGGRDAISPKLTFTAQNPNVTISPLVTKEFVKGLLTRVDPATIDEFLAQGWRREVMLPLAIGGVVCNDSDVRINDGRDAARDALFRSGLSAGDFSAYSQPSTATFTELRMSGKDAAALLKDGVGKSFEIAEISRNKEQGAALDNVVVRLRKSGTPSIGGLRAFAQAVCGGPQQQKSDRSFANATKSAAYVASSEEEVQGFILRSIQGMFLYLGNVHRRNLAADGGCDRDTLSPRVSSLFYLRRVCGEVEGSGNLVFTRFNGQNFYVPRGQVDRGDLTAETLAALSELVALQTSDASLQAAAPIIAVGQ
jgi:hypothetical protein